MAQAPWYLQPTNLGANQTGFAPTGTGWDWGTAGPLGYTGNTRGDNEIEMVGDKLVTVNGKQYIRVGSTDTTRFNQFNPQAGDLINHPTYGQLASLDLVDRAGAEFNSGLWNGPMPVLLAGAALGGVAAFGGAAGAAGAAGGEGALGGAAAGGEFGGFGAGAGAEGAGAVGAGEGAFGSGAASGGSFGGASGGGFNPLTDLPPGTTSVGNSFGNADAGAGYGYEIGGGTDGVVDGVAGAGASGGGGFDWGKFFSGSGSNWANLLGSGIGALSSWLASNAQVKSAEEANALMWAMYQQNRADLAPWRNAGGAAVNNLGGLLGLPGYTPVDYTKTPGYDFRYQQGMDELNNRLRAGGKFYSGDAIKGGQEYAQNFATNEFTNTINRNLALAGLGQTSAGTTVAAGTNAANQMGNNITGAGNARASGYVGMGNNIASGFGNYYNNQNQMDMMQLLMGGRTY